MPIVELHGVSRIYKLGGKEIRAVDDVSFAVEAGELVAIVGRSGSGKTTLLNLIGCLETPTGGSISIDGQNVGSNGAVSALDVRRSMAGFVFQNFHLIGTMSALDNVALGLRYSGHVRRKARELAQEALDAVGLADKARHRPSELSGGEQQRVAIARAIVKRPRLLLADEPTGELDSETAGEILDLLARFNRDIPQTILMATHDELAWSLATRILHMNDGRLNDDQKPEPS